MEFLVKRAGIVFLVLFGLGLLLMVLVVAGDALT